MRGKSDSPRILYITPFWPGGREIGARVRSVSVLRALREIGTVEVIVLDDEKATSTAIATPACELNGADGIEVERRPNKGLSEKLRWTLDPRSPYPNGCSLSAESLRRVLGNLEAFDLVWFFKLRSPDMFPSIAWKGSVVDVDDVPSTYERAKLRAARGLRERLLACRNLFTWRRREKLLGERFTVLSVCSQEDREYLERLRVKASIHVIPNGYDKPCVEPVRSPADPPRIGFIGLFDYFPNLEGLHWFVSRCWPRIKRQVPGARLRLVGPGSDGPSKPLLPDVEGLGWIADPAKEIRSWSVMVVPIRTGAGTRVKVAQAFSQKCPLVSTSLGAFGYGPMDGQNMYLADSVEAFSDACIKAIRDPERATQMAERAWHEFLEKWTWDAVSPRVWAAAEDCLRLKTGGSTRL